VDIFSPSGEADADDDSNRLVKEQLMRDSKVLAFNKVQSCDQFLLSATIMLSPKNAETRDFEFEAAIVEFQNDLGFRHVS
jgi:hypothetical protein